MNQLEKVIHNLQLLLLNRFGMYQPSGFCTEMLCVICYLVEDIRQYGNMKTLDVSLYKNHHVVLKEECRQTSCHLDSFLEEGVRIVEERIVFEELMNRNSHCAELYHRHQKKKVHDELVNSNIGEKVLLSNFKPLLKHIKTDSYEDGFTKIIIEKGRMIFKGSAVNLF